MQTSWCEPIRAVIPLGERCSPRSLRVATTLLLSSEIIAETIRVLRYPRLQKRFALTDDELYDYAQFLRPGSQTAILSQPYHAPLRDPDDLDVLQTAERGVVLCSNDGDFHEPVIVGYSRVLRGAGD